MAWEISISHEGWQEIYEACHRKSKTWLFKAINETLHQKGKKKYPQKQFRTLSQEALADEAYRLIEETNTCDIGGFNYWIDPQGCYKIEIKQKD